MDTTYNITYQSNMIFTAVHSGHNLSNHVSAKIGISNLERIREEDPFTDQFVNDKNNYIVQNTSRFEYDVNRSKTRAIYINPDDCWGLPIYQKKALNISEVEMSLKQYDIFYENLTNIIDTHLELYEKLIVWDIHSYNHRRGGKNAEFDSNIDNPEIIIGTNNYQYMSASWKPLIEQIDDMFKSYTFKGNFPNRSLKQNFLDVRQNIKYPGGYLSQFINKKYPDNVCCLAIEFKKIWMNEWTQEIDESCFYQLKNLFNDIAKKTSFLLTKEF